MQLLRSRRATCALAYVTKFSRVCTSLRSWEGHPRRAGREGGPRQSVVREVDLDNGGTMEDGGWRMDGWMDAPQRPRRRKKAATAGRDPQLRWSPCWQTQVCPCQGPCGGHLCTKDVAYGSPPGLTHLAFLTKRTIIPDFEQSPMLMSPKVFILQNTHRPIARDCKWKEVGQEKGLLRRHF